MNENYQTIRFVVEDRVARIALARPPLNVLDIALMRELEAALTDCMSLHDVVAILFEASPDSRAFSAGIALEERLPDQIYQTLDAFHSVFRTMNQLAKPCVAVVDGAAFGGGCELAAACDIVIASERARFGQPEIKFGVLPSVACAILPRIVGERRARELILTGELIDATEAARIGLVSHLAPSGQLAQKTQEILSRLRELSAPALETTRRALDAACARPFDEALEKIENLYLHELMKTEDAQEGVNAYLEKRKPAWKNR